MEPSFWKARWEEGRIGFHEGTPNAFLERHVARLGERGRVFVPLCGKAEDMAFLAKQGHEVVGIDLVESAVRDFFREHALEPVEEKSDRFTTLRAGAFTLHAGDVFAIEPRDLAGVTAVYDRAAVVALPPDLRTKYAAHLRSLVPAGTPILVVTFDYPQEKMEGPPFSVPEEELRRLYAGLSIERLDEAPIATGRLADAGVGATEQCWLVRT